MQEDIKRKNKLKCILSEIISSQLLTGATSTYESVRDTMAQHCSEEEFRQLAAEMKELYQGFENR